MCKTSFGKDWLIIAKVFFSKGSSTFSFLIRDVLATYTFNAQRSRNSFKSTTTKFTSSFLACCLRMRPNAQGSNLIILSAEPVVLRWWESETWKLGFIKRVDKDLENWGLEC